MTNLKDLRGHVSVVLTPALRRLALEHVQNTADYADDGESLVAWFDVDETPDHTVLDAAYSEAEALMIVAITRAIQELYLPDLDNSDLEAEERVRTISRY